MVGEHAGLRQFARDQPTGVYRIRRIELNRDDAAPVADAFVERPHRPLIAHRRVARDFNRVRELVSDERRERAARNARPDRDPQKAREGGRGCKAKHTISVGHDSFDLDVDDHVGAFNLRDERAQRRRSRLGAIDDPPQPRIGDAKSRECVLRRRDGGKNKGKQRNKRKRARCGHARRG